jgi:hypothetical protein
MTAREQVLQLQSALDAEDRHRKLLAALVKLLW